MATQTHLDNHAYRESVIKDISVDFYRVEYPDLQEMTDNDLAEHYITTGWIEGRNPNSWFDTVQYLTAYPDVAKERICPLFHFVGWGKMEGRRSYAPLSINVLNSKIFPGQKIDWVSLIRDEFDKDFYRTQLPDMWDDRINLAAHYLFNGWRLGLSPSIQYKRNQLRLFSPELEQNVPSLILDIASRQSPVSVRVSKPTARKDKAIVAKIRREKYVHTDVISQLVQVDYLRAVSSGDFGELMIAPTTHRQYDSHEKNLIAEWFDFDFYTNRYPDVAAAEIDGVEHYFYTGWMEGRDPTPWFNTKYYLTNYPDIVAAGVNPFWHYLATGKREGRLARSKGSAKRAQLEYLVPLDERTLNYPTPEHVRISNAELQKILKNAVAGVAGVVFSVSHDCYPIVTGGIQIFISDEQSRFHALGYAYVHLSPLRAALYVKDDAADATQTQIVVNSAVVGVASDAEISEALQNIRASLPEQRLFVVHSPLGHSVIGLAQIQSSLRPNHNFFWLHDYTSLCAGFNLLRNDVEYCGAPDAESEGCQICIYGVMRKIAEDRLRFLFDQCEFTLVSPSDVTRQIWLEASKLPHKGAVVVEHARLSQAAERLETGDPAKVGADGHPVRIAYIGYTTLLKGWLTFERILDETADFANYQFFHFATPGSLHVRKNLRCVESVVRVDDRHLMTRRLLENRIDLVIIAAEWPETFSYVTYEALAAGADIITLAKSGNVAATVSKTHRGLVFAHEDEIVEFFTSGKAIAYARARAKFGVYARELIHDGTTAALI